MDAVAVDAFAAFIIVLTLFHISCFLTDKIRSKPLVLSFCVASDKLVASLPSPVFSDNTQAHTFSICLLLASVLTGSRA
jgi:hypothetical protein